MNLLTFDIEEWSIEKMYHGERKDRIRSFDYHLNHILDLLDETHNSATFFCLGNIASDFPEVIKSIASRGHEIGCHSNSHKWITKMHPDEFMSDTHIAVSLIENIIGQKVESYRAPAFSICESNKWAFEILTSNGITNDASIFPGTRDFGGFPSFTSQSPCRINYKGIEINEFPIPLYEIPFNRIKLAYSGGGYFRLMPLRFVKRQISRSNYSMSYFHIEDLLTELLPFLSRNEYESYYNEPGALPTRVLRYLKSNIGRSSSLNKLDNLVRSYSFISIKQHLEQYKISETIKLSD